MEHEKKLIQLARKSLPLMRGFYLANGSAVMLKHHHRTSVDLDFFRVSPFSFRRLAANIRRHLKVSKEERGEDNLDLYINDIRVSFVYFPFKNVRSLEEIAGIPVASDYDLFLNKIYAAGRRVEPKDPWDAAALYKVHRWPSDQVKNDFEKKFPDQSYEITLGVLLSFEDYPDLPEWIPEVLRSLVHVGEGN